MWDLVQHIALFFGLERLMARFFGERGAAVAQAAKQAIDQRRETIRTRRKKTRNEILRLDDWAEDKLMKHWAKLQKRQDGSEALFVNRIGSLIEDFPDRVELRVALLELASMTDTERERWMAMTEDDTLRQWAGQVRRTADAVGNTAAPAMQQAAQDVRARINDVRANFGLRRI